MAKNHEINGELSEYKREIERARILFDEAAELAEPIIKLHMLYMASVCCDLLEQETKRYQYYQDAIKCIKELADKEYKRRSDLAGWGAVAADLLVKMGGLTYGGLGVYVGAGLLLGPVTGLVALGGFGYATLTEGGVADRVREKVYEQGVRSWSKLSIWNERLQPLNINVRDLYQDLNDAVDHRPTN